MAAATEEEISLREEIDAEHAKLDAASDEEAAEAVNATEDAELGEAAGRSIEDLAAEGPEDEDGQQLLDFGGKINLSIKGKRPTDSEIKVKAISTPINGQLGDIGDDEQVLYIGKALLDEIKIVTKRDGDRKVTSKARRHVMTPISFLPVRGKYIDKLNELIDEIEADMEAASK